MPFSGVTVIASGQVIPPFPGQHIRVTAAVLVASADISLSFADSSGTLTGNFPLSANSGFVLPYNPDGWFNTAVSSNLLRLLLGVGK